MNLDEQEEKVGGMMESLLIFGKIAEEKLIYFYEFEKKRKIWLKTWFFIVIRYNFHNDSNIWDI